MTRYRGTPVSGGAAAGEVYQGDAPAKAALVSDGPAAGVPTVRDAFAAVAASRAALAERLRAAGRDGDADIVRIGALMAADPALTGPALDAVRSGTPAPRAVREAAQAQASILEGLPDPDLAQRAGDVRQVAEAVIEQLTGAVPPPPPDGPFILVRREVDPADLIRLAGDAAVGDGGDGGDGRGRLVGAVSVGGGPSSHAAIIARGLGLPMLAGVGEAVLGAAAGHPAILDTATAALVVDPPPADLARVSPRPRSAPTATAGPGLVHTADGELVTVLCNVASAAETRLGLAGGAAGVGLLRTEIPFTHVRAWPSRDEHLARLTPVLALLTGKRAVVRLLDFSGDKIPPFPGAEGLRALLQAPGALRDQLAAIIAAGAATELAVMIPMVRTLDEVRHVRAELASAAMAAGTDPPPLGIMVEVAATAAAAADFAAHADFFSVGTNDLTADILGRERGALHPSAASRRSVVTLIAHVVGAARQAGIAVSVCGDAAADPQVLPLLLGAGVRTLSVGAARVPQVARWIAQTDAAEAAAKAADRHAS
ncbi:putative PEP-binding protein [Trebonia sp.]|uniref:putative PEP-binding protein n=1 Tax=Trebonia sp. TaxID=2767075 RepID=UPI00261E54CE|nr:putative PEP-binding protein [Trebonia sp.]